MIEDVVNDNVESERKFQPIDLSNTLSGNWVIARYEGEYFLGLILEITEKKDKARVQCLEKPFGITEPQSLEPYSNVFYDHDNLFKTNVIPSLVLDKSNRRKIKYTYTLWRYITMNVML